MITLKVIGTVYLAVGMSLGVICVLIVTWVRRCDRSLLKIREVVLWFFIPVIVGPAALVFLTGTFIVILVLAGLTEVWNDLQLRLAHSRTPHRILETFDLAGRPEVRNWLRGWDVVQCELCGKTILRRRARRPKHYPKSTILCPGCAAACSSPAPFASAHQ